MSSQAGFVTKNGNLSAKALKRIFKDGVVPKKLAKRQKVAKAKHLEDQEAEWEEISVSKTFKRSVEDLDKKRRLQEAAENFLKSGATQKELLATLAEAKIVQNTKIRAEIVTSNVLMQPDSPPCSLEEWERANLEHIIQEQRFGEDDGGRTPPISELFNKGIPVSDVAPSVAATSPANVLFTSSFSGSTSQAPHPSFGGAAVESAAGIAHCALQPTPGHSHCYDQAHVPLDAVPLTPLPPPLMLALLARLSSHIVGQRR
jgi:hypothetical protein